MIGRVLRILVLTCTSLLLGTPARGASEIVIAIRYLQEEGTSHSHLYLFREDGKLLRQLTNGNSAQDSAPIFAPDGSMIVFTREKPNNAREFWSVDPFGKALTKLEVAPDWYVTAKSSPYFTNVEPGESASPNSSPSPEEPVSPTATPIPTYKSPDGSVELILREDLNDEDDQIDGPGHGKHYLLRDLKTGKETEFGKLPGFYGVFGLLHDNQDKDQHFLFEAPLRLAFFDLHLNSTDGKLLLHGALGRKTEQDSLCARKIRGALLRRVDLSARQKSWCDHTAAERRVIRDEEELDGCFPDGVVVG
jgi:hypothetical protein